MKIQMSITPKMCGPVSCGTVGLIKLLRSSLGLSLGEAKGYVDKCIFDREQVEIPVPDDVSAEDMVIKISKLETPAIFDVKVTEN